MADGSSIDAALYTLVDIIVRICRHSDMLPPLENEQCNKKRLIALPRYAGLTKAF
jgi:hypothetical protein